MYDLISRKALLEELDKWINPCVNYDKSEFLSGIATAISEVETAPTVDAAPVVLQNVKYTDSDGEKALRHAMYMCGVQNNPVTRYTADAIAEKLTREAAEAALDAMRGENNA